MNRSLATGLGLQWFVARRSLFIVTMLLAVLSGAFGVALSNALPGNSLLGVMLSPKGQADLILRSGFETGETSVICSPEEFDLDSDGLLDSNRMRPRRTLCNHRCAGAFRVVPDRAGAARDAEPCVFHAKPVTRSTASRSLIPRQAGHRFHGKPVGG